MRMTLFYLYLLVFSYIAGSFLRHSSGDPGRTLWMMALIFILVAIVGLILRTIRYFRLRKSV